MHRDREFVIGRYIFIFLVATGVLSCLKEDETTHETRLKAPARTYSVTARIDNKEAGNDSQATGILKGKYDERTKVLSFSISFEGVETRAIRFKKGARGSAGSLVWNIAANENGSYKTPVSGQKVLTALQERELLKGGWFVTIDSELRSPEIRGFITLKIK
ncbi:CHRD domain-containing protein [Arcticibacter tournemirensis]|uniref:CHRD domain-containing protein n=2 Tax=Pseudomonadati TaxID=3379134 RepID=A0A4Q0M7U3_9SPHI|nr:CHRD domain-containing protein [Arcticibacter tournemirensis]RXF69085.1 CHRD domain-containing protein [Arcticibacter tournemirensis]